MSQRSLGMDGSEVIDDTLLHESGENDLGWFCISMLNDTVLATGIAASNIDNIAGFVGITLLAGTKLYGKFTAIKLTSGIVQAYKIPDLTF
jgi:hypothetical protein